MSVEAMAVVLHHAECSGTDKVVLLGIANHDGDGGAWPAISTLAKYAGVAERTVQRSINALQEMGYIRVHVQRGGTLDSRADRRPNRYDVLVRCPDGCDRTTQHHMSGVTQVSPRGGERGDVGVAHGVTSVTPRGDVGVTLTIQEPSSEPSFSCSPAEPASLCTDDFTAFWDAYPRKVGKTAAMRAWAKVVDLVPADEVVSAAVALAADPNLPDMPFIPHPATWLNRGGWEDDPYPVRTPTFAEEEAKIFGPGAERARARMAARDAQVMAARAAQQ